MEDFEKTYKSVKALMDVQDIENALLIADNTTKKHPKDERIAKLKIRLQMMNKNYKGALITCENVLKQNNKNATLWFWKGAIYERLRQQDKAQICYHKFKELNPERTYVDPAPAFTLKEYPRPSWPKEKSVNAKKVEVYFTQPELLQESDKALCDLFMTADPQVRRKLKEAFPDMYQEFLDAERGIYVLVKYNELRWAET